MHFKKELKVSQKKIMLLCNKLKWNPHISDMFVNRIVSSIKTINKFQTEFVMYKVMNNLAPSHFVLMLNFSADIFSFTQESVIICMHNLLELNIETFQYSNTRCFF